MFDLTMWLLLASTVSDLTTSPTHAEIGEAVVYQLPGGRVAHAIDCSAKPVKAIPINVQQAVERNVLLCDKCCRPKSSYATRRWPGKTSKDVTNWVITKTYTPPPERTTYTPSQAQAHVEAHPASSMIDSAISERRSESPPTFSSLCGATTKKGTSCRNPVKGGGRCHLHR